MALYRTLAQIALSDTPHYDVVIVGLGPTGATLANLLALCGLKLLVLEREPALYKLPRAVHFDDETMRVFQTVGVADALSEKVRINPGMRFVDGHGNVILDWPRPQAVTDQGWHASYRLHQPDLDKLLRDALSHYENCTVLTGASLTGATDRQDLVDFCYDHRGEAVEASTAYLVGCDGANSTVRQLMDTALDDLGFHERWLVVDVILNQEVPRLGDHTIQYCDPNHPMTYCRNPGRRRRWEMALSEGLSDQEAVNEKRIWRLLKPWITPAIATIERRAVYTFRSSVAAKWRCKRLLIAGDSAHLTPPFMGQGMCAGIRDAANLAWKLAIACRQPQRVDLLDTYQAERDPHVRRFIETAVNLGRLINSVDPHTADALRTGDNNAVMATPTPAIGAILSDWLALTPQTDNGTLCSQPLLHGGQSLDVAAGYRFALITTRADLSLPVPVFNAAGQPELTHLLQQHNAVGLLLRPDRYLAAIARTDVELDNLLGAITHAELHKVQSAVTQH